MTLEYVCCFRQEDLNNQLEVVSKSINDFCQVFANSRCHINKDLPKLAEALFSFSKFKIGDKVFFQKAPDCNNGWNPSKHYLVAGNTAIVHDISLDCYLDIETNINKFFFVYTVSPSNQTYISTYSFSDLSVNELSREYYYSLSEEYFSSEYDFSDNGIMNIWDEEDGNGKKYQVATFVKSSGIETFIRRRVEDEWVKNIAPEPKKCHLCGK